MFWNHAISMDSPSWYLHIFSFLEFGSDQLFLSMYCSIAEPIEKKTRMSDWDQNTKYEIYFWQNRTRKCYWDQGQHRQHASSHLELNLSIQVGMELLGIGGPMMLHLVQGGVWPGACWLEEGRTNVSCGWVAKTPEKKEPRLSHTYSFVFSLSQ